MVRSHYTDDLVQETFIKAWSNFDRFNNKSSFRTWIYRITMNTVYDHLRKQKSLKEVSSENQEHADSVDGEEKLLLKDIIDKGMMDLNENAREVFILFYKLEYTISEISSLIGIPAGTVKSRLHKAREDFEKILKKHGAHYE
jgi:RNA polymerase sigma-70 factor (ECF subfamily)